VSLRGRAVIALMTAAVLVAAGCEHGITVSGKVRIPLEVQREFSKDAPGIVVMGGGSSGSNVTAQLLAVLCDPASAELAVPFYQDQYGCASEGTLWFWVTRVAPMDRASLTCGVHQEDFGAVIGHGKVTVPDSFDKDKTVAAANVTIFKGKGKAPCRSGEENIDVAVTPTTAPAP
jgi:hypothetical protein